MAMPVRVYAFTLAAADHDLSAYRATLDVEERARCAACHTAADAERYLVAHGVLRQILGRRLAQPPAQVQFTRSASGQPLLTAASGVTFSLTHGSRHGLVAIGERVRIGVDLEDGAAPTDLLNVARLVCTAQEMRILITAPPPLRPAIFLFFWVRKEAVLKALGTGFLTDPRQLDTSVSGMLCIDAQCWSCIDLSIAPSLLALGCTAPAALAIEHPIAQLSSSA
jgi:4'-phosphopantetheinyl transferase